MQYRSIPLTAAQMDQPGVAIQMVREFDSIPHDLHDDASIHLLSPIVPSLRNEILAIAPDGTNLSPGVLQELTIYKNMSIDESCVEGIHSVVHGIETSPSTTHCAFCCLGIPTSEFGIC